MRTAKFYPLLICISLFCKICWGQSAGTIKIDTVHSTALLNNVTGENPNRPFSIYLPPGYYDAEERFPVIYLLHGTSDDHMNFTDDTAKYHTVQDLMNEGIARGRFGKMIIVTPNENTNWFGSYYVNSAATGNWEDFTCTELVNYVDAHYRTLARAQSRAVIGHSMGGYGAIRLAMEHPGVFSVAYALNGGFIGFTGELNANNPEIKKFIRSKTVEELLATQSKIAIGMVAASQAFSPNPEFPPFFADKPYKLGKGKLVPNQPAYNKWKENDILLLAEKYRNNLLQLRAIKFDCGNNEEIKLIEINSKALSAKLTQLNIPHQFEQYNGDHRNRLWGLSGRFYTEVFPFVYDNLVK